MMDHQDERLRAALRQAAPEVDETGALQTVINRGRVFRRRRRYARVGVVVLVVALIGLGGAGVFRLVDDLRSHPADSGWSSMSPQTDGQSMGVASGETTLPSTATSTTEAVTTTASQPVTSVEYRNDEYGFSVSLPDSWEGYTIITEMWEGYHNQDIAAEGPVPGDPVYGPQLLIRHPLWTESDPRQDIPIMIFTLTNWDAVRYGRLTVGAAPIPPTELGRNATYVFALPARYNYAFPTGYQEVEEILKSHPLHAGGWSGSTDGNTAVAVSALEPPSATTSETALSQSYEIVASDSGKSFVYTVTSRFSLILDSTNYPPGEVIITPGGVIGEISNIPSVDPPLQAYRFEGVAPGQCTIQDRDFVVNIGIVPLPD